MTGPQKSADLGLTGDVSHERRCHIEAPSFLLLLSMARPGRAEGLSGLCPLGSQM
jgi:hypothetical protein